jgi:hypothetical protein
MNWQGLPNRQASRVALFKDDVDTVNEADWPSQHAWIANHLEKFDRAFRQRVKNLDASDWVSDEQMVNQFSSRFEARVTARTAAALRDFVCNEKAILERLLFWSAHSVSGDHSGHV